jgi:TolB-like protein/tetratricopeptide (TPR) repeat protein
MSMFFSLYSLKKFVTVFMAGLITVFLASCGSTTPSTSQPNGNYGTCGVLDGSFVGDWFDYYKRAITWMDCEQWQEAQSDLTAALKVRSKDKRRVYTSGMHFLNNYFPNRELGVTLYYQQKYDAAVDALRISFEQFPSEKARVFLLLALQNSSKYQQADQSAPKIIKTQENADFIRLTLTDDQFISRLLVNGQAYPIRATTVIDNTTITFEPVTSSIELQLDKALYRGQTLTLTLLDVFDKQTELLLGVSNDITPPVISVLNKSQTGGQTQWQFSAADQQSDIRSIYIDGEAVAFTAGVKTNFKVASQQQKVLVEVADAAGNTAKQEFVNGMTQNLMLDVEVASTVTQENQVLLSIFMQSPQGLTELTINTEKVALQGVGESFINYLFPLQSGVNTINLTLKDGLETEYVSVEVLKEPPEGFDFSDRLKLAVFPFDCEQNKTASCWDKNQVFDDYFAEFSDRRRFQVVSRNNLSERVQQLKLCEFALSEKCAWEATQLIGSQAMLVAEETRRTTNNITTVEVYAKIIDAKSGELLITFDTYQQLPQQQSLDSRYLVNKIHSYFPLLNFGLTEGKVSVQDSSFVPWHKMPLVGHQNSSSDTPCFTGNLVKKGNNLKLNLAPDCQVQQLQNL